jgi:hypothetical protein
MKTTTLLALAALFLPGCAVASQQACFESDKTDEATRTEWSHQYFVVQLGPIQRGPGARRYRWVTGYGYNTAGDLVPITGSAVQNNESRWLVSITGTLHQKSTVGMHDDILDPRYWIISQSWEFDPGAMQAGSSHQGNITTLFSPGRVAADDSFDSYLWRVDCSTLPQ